MKRCVALVWLGLSHAWGVTKVIEAPLPDDLPAKVENIAAPVVMAQSWTGAEAKAKVREFLKADHSEEEKIAVLTWWAGQAERQDFLVDLARRCAVAGRLDECIFWLQRAAHEDVCDPGELENEPDFAPLLKDARWPKLKAFLRECEARWQQTTFYRDVLTLPTDYDGKTPIPLVVGLHGYGSVPEDFAGADFQKICDAQHIAFLAVSGRRPLGRHAFMWTESFEKDRQHIEQAMLRSLQHLQVAPGRTVAAGFSQGGQLATELAAAQPNKYRGCLSMSPGSRYASELLSRLKQTNASLTGQQYFFSWISGEGRGPAQRVKEWRPALEQRNARVYEYEFPGKGHEWPRHYEDYFAISLQVLLR